MNGVLYLLTGCCVAGAIVAAFFVRVDIARVSTTDATVAFWFLLALAAAFFFLAYTRWGRMWRSRVDKKAADEDKRVRETVGKVRQPPFDLGSWP
jgi:branched-subunit amino acid ABC-type transport system permease component